VADDQAQPEDVVADRVLVRHGGVYCPKPSQQNAVRLRETR
jgi:hypothetical protein